MKLMKRALAKEAAWVLGGRALAAIGIAISLKLITQYLSVAQMGIFGLALAINNATSRALFFPLGQSMLRYASGAIDDGSFRALWSVYARHYMAVAGSLMAVGLLVAVVGPPWLSSIEFMLALAVGCCTGLYSGNVSTMNGLRWRRKTALSQIWIGWGRGLLAVALMIALGASPAIALAGYVCAQMTCIAWQISTILGGTAPAKDTPIAALEVPDDKSKAFRAYALPFAAIFTLEVAAQEFDKILVAAYFTTAQLGAYVTLQLLARLPVLFVVGFVEQLVYPIFFQGAKGMDDAQMTRANFYRTGKVYLAVLAPLIVFAAAVWAFRTPLITLMTTAEYAEYGAILPMLLFAGVVAQSARILQTTGLRAIGSRIFVPAKIVQVIVFFGAAFALMPSMGLRGVAAAAIIAALSLVAAILVTNYWHIRRVERAGLAE